MLGLVIAFALGGFAVGSYATYRYAPPLTRAHGSVAVGFIVCLLVGAAVGLACMYAYLAIHGLIHEPGLRAPLVDGNAQPASASPDASIFVNAVFSIASESGLLLAVAAGLYLLSSPTNDSQVS